jgi:PST family polysaccharide transporter
VTVGAQWGVVGVAAGYATAAVLTETAFLIVTSRVAEVSPLALPRALAGVFAAGGMMAAIVWAAGRLLEAMGATSATKLGVMVAVGAVSYVPLCWQLVPDVRDEILRRFGRGPAESTAPA